VAVIVSVRLKTSPTNVSLIRKRRRLGPRPKHQCYTRGALPSPLPLSLCPLIFLSLLALIV